MSRSEPSRGWRAAWRRTVLFALEVHPKWWGRVGVLFVAGALLLAAYWWTRATHTALLPCAFSYVEQGPDRWSIVATYHGDRAFYQFSAPIHYERGPWWESWRMPRMRPQAQNAAALEGPAPAPDQLEAARLAGLLHMTMVHQQSRRASPNAHVYDRALTLAQDQRTWSWGGWFYWPRRLLLALGLSGITIGAVLSTLRGWVRQEHQKRLKLTELGVCPGCQYPLGGLPTTVCPECGLDILRTVQESRRELGLSR